MKKEWRTYNPTAAQIKSQELFKELHSKWVDLTDKQKDQWNNAAKDRRVKILLPSSRIMKGWSLFFAISRYLQEINEPLRKDPPDINSIERPTIPEINMDTGDDVDKNEMKLYIKTPIESYEKMIISATKPLSGGQRKLDDSWYKKIAVIDSTFKDGTSIEKEYLSVFNEIDPKARKIGFRFKTVHKLYGVRSSKVEIQMPINQSKKQNLSQDLTIT